MRIFGLVFLLALIGCVDRGAGIAVRDLAIDKAGPLRCLGLEGHDIINISRAAVQDIQNNFLKPNPQLAPEGRPIRIIIDSTRFANQTDQNINLNMITDQLAVNLQRSAGKKIAFISREDFDAAQKERALKRQGEVDQGALGLVDRLAGADYRMGGRISALKSQGALADQQTTTISLRLIDLETGALVWSWVKNISKGGWDDIYCQ